MDRKKYVTDEAFKYVDCMIKNSVTGIEAEIWGTVRDLMYAGKSQVVVRLQEREQTKLDVQLALSRAGLLTDEMREVISLAERSRV